ncbi:MAG: hypothetical protein KF777_00200 [Planctomycetaceae bacterium]|nr:hypothetical protein [Planctomycetaceae bacterium]
MTPGREGLQVVQTGHVSTVDPKSRDCRLQQPERLVFLFFGRGLGKRQIQFCL